MTNERLQGEEQFHSKNYLSVMPRFHAKMRLKSASQKLNFVLAQAVHWIVAANDLEPSRIVTHNNTASFSIKTILCETNNIPFSKNY